MVSMELRSKEAFVGWLKTLAGKVWGGLKKTGGWVAQHGPVFSSAILGVSFVVPALRPVAAALGAIMGGGSAAADPELSKAIGELLVGGIAILGTVRKVIALAKPKLS